jgi:hypothetical protein
LRAHVTVHIHFSWTRDLIRQKYSRFRPGGACNHTLGPIFFWPIGEVVIEPLHTPETSALNEEYNQAVHRGDRQDTGEEVHDARCPTALNIGC